MYTVSDTVSRSDCLQWVMTTKVCVCVCVCVCSCMCACVCVCVCVCTLGVHACARTCALCMTLFHIVILTVGHDSTPIGAYVCCV